LASAAVRAQARELERLMDGLFAPLPQQQQQQPPPVLVVASSSAPLVVAMTTTTAQQQQQHHHHHPSFMPPPSASLAAARRFSPSDAIDNLAAAARGAAAAAAAAGLAPLPPLPTPQERCVAATAAAVSQLPPLFPNAHLLVPPSAAAAAGGGGRGSSSGGATTAAANNSNESDPAPRAWRRALDRDALSLRADANALSLCAALAQRRMAAPARDVRLVAASAASASSPSDTVLSAEHAQRLVAWAAGAAVARQHPAAPAACVGGAPAAARMLSEAAAPTTAVLVAAAATGVGAGDDQGKKEEDDKEEQTARPAKTARVDEAAVAAAAAVPAAPLPSAEPPILLLTARDLSAGLALLRAAAAEAAGRPCLPARAVPDARRAAEAAAENEFEKRLLGEFVPADEMTVGFADIGALDRPKALLREVVALPLARPELFTRGALAKPVKGVLLFGPPGTGKTLLAKAVAKEAGANFISVSAAAISSKWLGEGEKLVRAMWSLSRKLSPCVIFIDEADALLSRRGGGASGGGGSGSGGGSEHEANRKIKNELMAGWDGLRTRESDRVVVLCATNRPQDLDDAFLRRLPRRVLVDLPDVTARERILRVLLRDEVVEAPPPSGDAAEEDGGAVAALAAAVARLTDGYTGSDLRNLCTTAAYAPIRDLLAAEAEAEEAAAAGGGAKSEEKKEKKTKRGGTCDDDGDDASAFAAVVDAAIRRAAAAADGTAAPAPSSAAAPPGAPPPRSALAGGLLAVPEAAPPPGWASPRPGAAGGHVAQQQAAAARSAPPQLRAITLEDFKRAQRSVGPSTSADAATMQDLRAWQDRYGEGGSRGADARGALSYYM